MQTKFIRNEANLQKVGTACSSDVSLAVNGTQALHESIRLCMSMKQRRCVHDWNDRVTLQRQTRIPKTHQTLHLFIANSKEYSRTSCTLCGWSVTQGEVCTPGTVCSELKAYAAPKCKRVSRAVHVRMWSIDRLVLKNSKRRKDSDKETDFYFEARTA